MQSKAFVVFDNEVEEYDIQENKWFVESEIKKETELYGEPVCIKPLNQIQEQYVPMYFFWLKKGYENVNIDSSFPDKITKENFRSKDIYTSNPLIGWTKKHFADYILDVVVPKLAIRYSLDVAVLNNQVIETKTRNKYYKNFWSKRELRGITYTHIVKGKLPRLKETKRLLGFIDSDLHRLLKAHFQELQGLYNKRQLSSTKWRELISKLLSSRELQHNILYRLMRASTPNHHFNTLQLEILLYSKLFETYSIPIEDFIPSKSAIKKLANYRLITYLSYPDMFKVPNQVSDEYEFSYFFWFKKSLTLPDVTDKTFDYTSCMSFRGWTKKELLIFINDLYLNMLTSDDALIRDIVFNKIAQFAKKNVLCKYIREQISGNKPSSQFLIKKFKGAIKNAVLQLAEEATQHNDAKLWENLINDADYEEIIMEEYGEDFDFRELVAQNRKMPVNDIFNNKDAPFQRYLNVINIQRVTRFEEQLNAHPSERTERAHYNYITNLSKNKKTALRQYQNSSTTLNEILRFNEIPKVSETFLTDTIEQIGLLRDIIQSAPILDKDITVYRGDSFAQHLEAGEYITFNTFLSTSISLYSASRFLTKGGCCILEFVIPKDSFISILIYTMPYVEEFRTEFEVLLMNGTKWLVTQKGTRTLENKKTVTTYRLKFVDSKFTKQIFKKYCVKDIGRISIDSPVKQMVQQCVRQSPSKECNIVMSGLRLGHIMSDVESVENLCNSIQADRRMAFNTEVFQKYSHELCLKDLEKRGFNVTNVLGQGAAGKVVKVCECMDNNCIINNCVAIKQTPIWSLQELTFKDSFTSEDAMHYQSWVEIMANTLATTLIEQGICANYVGLYHWFICKESANSVYLVNEVANYGTLVKWLKVPRSKRELFCMAFQVYAGLYCLKKHFGMIHGDLHSENVLVMNKSEERTSYVEYVMNGESIFIPDNGFQFLIADFGRAWIPQKMEIQFHVDENKWYEKELLRHGLTDMYELDWKKFLQSVGNAYIPQDIETFLQVIKSEFAAIPPGYNRSMTCDMDKKPILPTSLLRFGS